MIMKVDWGHIEKQIGFNVVNIKSRFKLAERYFKFLDLEQRRRLLKKGKI